MYDWPAVAPATRALHEAVGLALEDGGLGGGPVLIQTCGLPFATRLRHDYAYVATPVYDVEGYGRGTYSSAVVVRRDDPARSVADLEGRTAAVNAPDSYSGALALKLALAEAGLNPPGFKRVVETGSHLGSIEAVAAGRADVAAIDAVCWALARAHKPEAADRLRVLQWTVPAPGLPIVTPIPAEDIEGLRTTLGSAIAAMPASARAALFLEGIEVIDVEHYHAIGDQAARMSAAGWDWPMSASDN